jgi:DNA polymerase-4
VTRKIIHIDMDAFFASVEQRDDPALRGLPVAVGGSAARGVVAAASYEARRFGVRSAMPGASARRLCPDLVFVRPRFEVYREVSAQIRQIFLDYTELVEPLSLDEAYLDVTRDLKGMGSAVQIAREIRARIRAELGLSASAGVSYNKFIAKLASDQNKPDGLCVILPEQGADYVASLPARRFFGVGPKTAERMAALGIHTGADLRKCSLGFLQRHFGKSAAYLFGACRGEDERAVRPNRRRKSIGAERTYAQDLLDREAIEDALAALAAQVWSRARALRCSGRTLTLKLRFADFQQLTRARSYPIPVASEAELLDRATALFAQLLPLRHRVRLLGLALSGLVAEPDTLQVLREPPPRQQCLNF